MDGPQQLALQMGPPMVSNSQHTYQRLEQTPKCTFVLWDPSVDLCGLQRVAFAQPRMLCHQSLDPVPEMARVILQTAQRPIRSRSASVPGLAVRAHLNINAIACNLAKTINATSSVISAINHELQDLRKAILQNRAAIDYLLLCQHLGCESFEGMCCFNISDNSQTIQHQIDILHNLASDLKIDTLGSWWESLLAWLSTGLLGNILR